MKTVKYLFFCFLEALDVSSFFVKDFIIGFIQIIVYGAAYIFFERLTTWYYAILLTLGFILAFYGIVCIVELFVKLIKRLIKPKDRL